MKIAIPTCGADGGKSGISRYLIQLLKEFAKDESGIEFQLIVYESEKNIFLPTNANNFSVYTIPENSKSPVKSLLWTFLKLPSLIKKIKSDVVFMPAANRRLTLSYPCPSVGTVHDFSSLHVEAKYDAARMFYIKKVLPFLIKKLDHILTVSECSKKDIVQYVGVQPDKVTVTHLACDNNEFNTTSSESANKRIRKNYKIDAPYFIYISRLEHPGKNHVSLIKAYNKMRNKINEKFLLVLAGSDWNGSDEVHALAEQSDYKSDIIFTGFVPQCDTAELYRASIAMVFPSRFEGFGLPILEAMASGTPVACSNCSSLPEIAGDAAMLFDPMDIDNISNVLEVLALDVDRRKTLRQKGLDRAEEFSWKKTAELTLNSLKNVLKEKSNG